MTVERWMWIVMVGTIIPMEAAALELKEVQIQDITNSFPISRSFEGNLIMKVVGQSFEVHKNLRVQMEPKDLIYAGISWGGVIMIQDLKKAKTLGFGDKIKIQSEGTLIKPDKKGEIMMSAYADITKMLKKQKESMIRKNADYIYGGFTVISIYKNESAPKRWIGVKMGLAQTKPGDIYGVRLVKQSIPGQVSQFSTWGAGAIAGNGSANILNGVTVSGLEDWDGSQGVKWDTDTVDVRPYQIRATNGLTWSIDPLLQWLYPMGAVISIDLTEGK